MLTVACVSTGDYCGRGEEYVERLRAGIAQHLNAAHRFAVVRDGPPSWWAKTNLFQPGRFSGRVLYLDLDSIVVGPLDPLAEAKGILHLERWGWKQNDFGSGVMVWDAGEHEDIFTRYTPEVPGRFRGDQDWLTYLGGWPALPDGICVSYRYHCKRGVPKGASVVCFHGSPKPHELGWRLP